MCRLSDPDFNLEDLLDQIEKSGPPPSEAVKHKVEEQKEASKDKPQRGSLDVEPSDFRSRMDTAIQEIRDRPESQLLEKKHDIEDVSDELMNQFGEAIGRFNKISGKILKDYEIDRLQAQAALDHYFETIEKGGRIPRVYIEKLADVLRAKNEIALTPVRLLDSITKFMSAAKNNNVLIQNVNQGGPDLSDLSTLLNQAEKYDDEEIGS